MNKKDIEATTAESQSGKSITQGLTLKAARSIAQRFSYEMELQRKAEFFGRWLNVLNLTPVVDKLDVQRSINEDEAIAKRKHYNRVRR